MLTPAVVLGVTFTSTVDTVDSNGALIPYGLPAVYELLRYVYCRV